MPGFLYDAVTLQHFAAANRLNLLVKLHKDASPPRWTEEVRDEVERGAARLESSRWCRPVIELSWMGPPAPEADVFETLRLRALLDDGQGDSDKHLGEATSIVVAKEIGASFVTDDAGAYDFAVHPRQLGPGRVVDACELLHTAHSHGLLGPGDVRDFHIAVFDAGRTMRCRCQQWPNAMDLDARLRELRRR